MGGGDLGSVDEARDEAWTLPLHKLNPAQPARFQNDTIWPIFERLRRESPVHLTAESDYGMFWSVTRFSDIMAVDSNHEAFSSIGGVTIEKESGEWPMFIAMDEPRHGAQRNTVSPALNPGNLSRLEPLIRERAAKILDSLPIGQEFDWVDKVSMELTAMTLATLFGVPQEDRRRLTYWSDIVSALPGGGLIAAREDKFPIYAEYQRYFADLWEDRAKSAPTNDLVSMLAHGPHTRSMPPVEYFGNIVLLTVGGNDTSRNTISGSLLALNQNPEQYQKLRENPQLIPSMISETIRWQTPLAHMRRVATQDVKLDGKAIRKGMRVVMWYVSGNRDESVIQDPNAFIIDRERPRHHLSFGFGVHRCLGNRLAELQLRVIWEEILARFPVIEVLGEPRRVYSTFVRGYEHLPVVIPARH